MAWYRYKLLDHQGRPRGGLIDLPFENPLSATTYLERQGGTVVFLQPLPGVLGILVTLVYRFFQRPVKPEETAEVLTNFSVMLRAGIPAITAIRDSMGQSDNPTLSRIGREIVTRVEGGATLANAFGTYPRVFPQTVSFLLGIGEQSGTLDRTSRDAANHVKRLNQIRDDVKKAVTYPTFMLLAIFTALGFWLAVVVPTVTELFESFDLDLPALTLGIIAVADVIGEYTFTVLTAIVVTITAVMAAVKNVPWLRRLWHKALLRIPVFGRIAAISNIAFISEYLSLLLSAGVDMLSSLRTLRGSVKNEVYRERLQIVADELVAGRAMKDAFESAGVFPPFVQRMVSVGEESGSLTEQLQYVAEEYERRLNSLVAGLSKAIEPIALMIGGGLFALVAAGLFLPIYQLIGDVAAM